MNTNTNPIDLLIVALLALVEGICWVINELTGGHPTQATREFWENVEEVQQITDHETTTIAFEPANTFDFDAVWNEYASQIRADRFRTLTVKELRQLTGITNSRYRKADLIQLAIAC